MKWKMYKTHVFFAASCVVLLLWFGLVSKSVQSSPEEKPSPELIAKGKKLFNSKEGLGTKYACILCHQKEKTLKRSKILQAGDGLPDLINKSLTEKAKGKPLDRNSEEMKALVAYITYEHSKST